MSINNKSLVNDVGLYVRVLNELTVRQSVPKNLMNVD